MTHFSNTADMSLILSAKRINRQSLTATREQWHRTCFLDPAERDIFAARLIWNCTPAAELNKYAAAPSRAAFKAIYQKFVSKTRAVMKGAMGPYQIKCTLDPMTIGG